jgi:hypothetical protein
MTSRALLVAGLRLAVVLIRCMAGDAMIVMSCLRVAGGIGLHAVVAIGVDVARSQRGHVSAQAAGAERYSNHENSQNVVGRLAHTIEKPKDSWMVKPNPTFLKTRI